MSRYVCAGDLQASSCCWHFAADCVYHNAALLFLLKLTFFSSINACIESFGGPVGSVAIDQGAAERFCPCALAKDPSEKHFPSVADCIPLGALRR